jgi:hypothetical protein
MNHLPILAAEPLTTADQVSCPECHRLLAALDGRKRVYSSAGDWLISIAESGDAANSREMRAASEESRIDVELARLELQRHKREHAQGPKSSLPGGE